MFYYLWKLTQIRAASVLLTLLLIIHPFIHQFEGGSLDAFMATLAQMAMQED
jgi:hypothetical protein